MDFLNFVLNLLVPPTSLITLAFSWPALCFLNACEWLYNSIYGEDMDNKVVIITGASSGIGEVSYVCFLIDRKGKKVKLFCVIFLMCVWFGIAANCI